MKIMQKFRVYSSDIFLGEISGHTISTAQRKANKKWWVGVWLTSVNSKK